MFILLTETGVQVYPAYRNKRPELNPGGHRLRTEGAPDEPANPDPDLIRR